MNEMIMVCHSVSNNTRTGLVISLCLKTNPLINLIPPESPQILDIRELKQHDAAIRRRRSLVKCLFNCKNASLITGPI